MSTDRRRAEQPIRCVGWCRERVERDGEDEFWPALHAVRASSLDCTAWWARPHCPNIRSVYRRSSSRGAIRFLSRHPSRRCDVTRCDMGSQALIRAGLTFIDTAEVYGFGKSEVRAGPGMPRPTWHVSRPRSSAPPPSPLSAPLTQELHRGSWTVSRRPLASLLILVIRYLSRPLCC